MNTKTAAAKGENVEDVNVVVSPFRPRMGEVQELKREVCNVRRENSGGYEIFQEASALLPVGPLSVRERKLPQSTPPVDCSFSDKHVLIDRAGHTVIFEESVKLQATEKHQERTSKLPHQGKRAQLEA